LKSDSRLRGNDGANISDALSSDSRSTSFAIEGILRGNDAAKISDALPSDSRVRTNGASKIPYALPTTARQIHIVCKESSS